MTFDYRKMCGEQLRENFKQQQVPRYKLDVTHEDADELAASIQAKDYEDKYHMLNDAPKNIRIDNTTPPVPNKAVTNSEKPRLFSRSIVSFLNDLILLLLRLPSVWLVMLMFIQLVFPCYAADNPPDKRYIESFCLCTTIDTDNCLLFFTLDLRNVLPYNAQRCFCNPTASHFNEALLNRFDLFLAVDDAMKLNSLDSNRIYHDFTPVNVSSDAGTWFRIYYGPGLLDIVSTQMMRNGEDHNYVTATPKQSDAESSPLSAKEEVDQKSSKVLTWSIAVVIGVIVVVFIVGLFLILRKKQNKMIEQKNPKMETLL